MHVSLGALIASRFAMYLSTHAHNSRPYAVKKNDLQVDIIFVVSAFSIDFCHVNFFPSVEYAHTSEPLVYQRSLASHFGF